MSPLSNARTIFTLVFLFVIVAASGVNAYLNGGPVLKAITTVPEPVTVHNAGDNFKQASTEAEKHFFGQYHARSMRARFMAMLGKREMNNFAVIRAPDGRLYHGGLFPIYTENARKLAKSVGHFVKAAKEKGTDVLYLAAPARVPKGEALQSDGLPILDYNSAIDTLMYVLREKKIHALDSRYAFLSDGFPTADITPRTATLLTGKASFALFTYLLDALEQQFDLVLDINGYHRNLANYKVRNYPQFFMGALGHETGPAFSGLDDFVAIAPNFETEYSLEGLDMFGAEIRDEGNAEQTILNPGALLYYDNLYNLYPESYYLHTNMSRSRVQNPRNPGGPKLLFIHDFYTAQLVNLLAPMCSEIHTLAYQENQPLSAEEYIQDKNFDCVVISLFPPNILRPESQTLIARERPEDEDDDDLFNE